MEDLTPIEQSIVEALKGLGATKDTSIKSADDIAKKCSRPKGLVTNSLIALTQKGVIKRIAREKIAGYYLVDTK
jgi:predicted transcriptional regulator